MPVVGQDPVGTPEVFDGWYRRGDDTPMPDFRSGVLEPWSQDWFRLAGGRGWVHSAQVAGFQPDDMRPVRWTAPPVRDVPIPEQGAHRIVVSIVRQHLWAFDGARLVVDTAIGTGRDELPTPTGTYRIFYKTSPFYMASDWPRSSPYWYEPAWVQYVMEFIAGGYFIHDAPWRTRWGPGANLVAGSHGCVNVPTSVMPDLYRWTALGDEVVVQER
jgi:lipoprotein-anchoring transpeptidase ErfK/SrfK